MPGTVEGNRMRLTRLREAGIEFSRDMVLHPDNTHQRSDDPKMPYQTQHIASQ